MPATLPSDETNRLHALYKVKILHTEKEERFDKITHYVSKLFRVPIAGIACIADGVVWYKSAIGIDQKEIPLVHAFEKEILEKGEPVLISNAQSHPIFSKSPLVMENPKVLSYLGIPLRSSDGYIVGALFIADRSPRVFDREITALLLPLTWWVELELNTKKDAIDEQLVKTQEELNTKNHDLQIAHARSETILESIGDAVVVINDKGEIIYANKKVETMLGFSRQELQGKLIFHALKLQDEKGEEIPITNYPIRNAIYTKEMQVNNTSYYVRKDGTRLAAFTTATPILISEVTIGGVMIFRDMGKEREVDRMKTEFISLASHQLRTPLSAMKWFTEMLLDGDIGTLTNEQKEVVTNIYQANERMIELVNTLLNISRIESGRIIIEPKLTSLQDLVDAVVLELTPKLNLKEHNLTINVDKALPKVLIDPKLVRHVYMNLLANAIKYTPQKGQIKVRITKSGNEIISQISDNGLGIPKEQQEQVFSKFFRAKNIIGIETDGTGLGLYLTKAIVESSGGKIWFESSEGTGTTFWFILPLSGSVKRMGEVTIDS